MKRIQFLGPNIVRRQISTEDFASCGLEGQPPIDIAPVDGRTPRIVEVSDEVAALLSEREPNGWKVLGDADEPEAEQTEEAKEPTSEDDSEEAPADEPKPKPRSRAGGKTE